jgi:alpha-galactosidase
MIKALKEKKRPVTISLSPGSAVPNATLAAAARDIATTWQQPLMARLTADFWDDWEPLAEHFTYAAELARFATPLFSPDLDMLPMGWIAHVGTGPRFSRLTDTEQRSMVNMWSMARAPLVWGGSPTLSNESTLALLSNQAVLDIQTTSCRNQVVGRPTSGSPSTNTTVVWVAQSAKSATGRFVGLWNLGQELATVTVEWAALGLDKAPEAGDVTELWAAGGRAHPVVGPLSLSAKLAPHDSALVRIA